MRRRGILRSLSLKQRSGKTTPGPKKLLPMKKPPAPQPKLPPTGEEAKTIAEAKPKPGPKTLLPTSKPSPKNVLKRPASSAGSCKGSDPPKKKPVLVSKGLYKNGTFGFKVNGKQVFAASRFEHVFISLVPFSLVPCLFGHCAVQLISNMPSSNLN